MTETNLPAPLPANGGLPANYEAAKHALAECTRIDECKTWADKAAALSSYARQAQDHTLYTLAQRIQDRATRRYGELLKQIPPARGARTDLGRAPTRGSDGQAVADPPVVTRARAARDAGLSEHQAKQGLRVASIPTADFEAAVESDHPPTVTELAARGTVTRPAAPAPAAADHAQAVQASALLRQFAAFCCAHEPVSIARAPGADADVLRGYVSTIDRWLDRLVTNLPEQDAAA